MEDAYLCMMELMQYTSSAEAYTETKVTNMFILEHTWETACSECKSISKLIEPDIQIGVSPTYFASNGKKGHISCRLFISAYVGFVFFGGGTSNRW